MKSYLISDLQTVKYKFQPSFRHVLKIIISGASCKNNLMKTYSNGVNATQLFCVMRTVGTDNR